MLSLNECREMEIAVMEAGRGREPDPALADHLEHCENCLTELRRQRRLSATLRSLSARTELQNAPPRVQNAIILEFRAIQHAVTRRRIGFAWAAGALAASFFLTWLVTNRPAPKPSAVSQAASVITQPEVTHTVELETARVGPRHRVAPARPKPPVPFVEIPYAEPLDPWERADVVRMDLPVTALIAVGFPMDTADPSARAMADVVVGQDGRARAVRLISISD